MIKVNGKEIKPTKFPNNEILIKREFDLKEENIIEFKFESNEDFITLMFIKKYIDSIYPRNKSKLHIKYIPYSRMDRTEGYTIFTLKYISEFINSLNFDRVVIFEPHSDVSTALLDRVQVVNLTEKITEDIIKRLDFTKDNDYIFYPDAGAMKRYSKQIEYPRVLTATKERDFKTGYIKKLVLDKTPEKPFRVIIVDDLCSKGGTFILSANKLKEAGATEIYLVVSHCENTILEGDVLKEGSPITKVFTTDSIINSDKASDRLEIGGIYR